VVRKIREQIQKLRVFVDFGLLRLNSILCVHKRTFWWSRSNTREILCEF